MCHDLPLPEALRELNRAGWNAVEVSTEHFEQIETAPDPAAVIAAACETAAQLELRMLQGHAWLLADVAHADRRRRRADIDRLRRHMEIAAQLGVGTVVIHPGGSSVADAVGRRRVPAQNTEAFRELAGFAAEHGLRIGIENMLGSVYAEPDELLALLADVGSPLVGVTLDTSHAHAAGLDLVAMIESLGPHLMATHISDNDGSGDQHKLPGNGGIDWVAVVQALRAAGYRGPFNLEIPGEHCAIPGLAALKIRHARQVVAWLLEEPA